ncbi:MAG: plastocyanin/azurin family copper-binding protein [Vicinamibacteria bacterium]|jgi:plastocyanin
MPVNKRHILIVTALAATAVTAVAVPVSSGSSEAKRATPKITVGDDYFAPDDDVTVKKNSKVKWVWDANNTDTHNVAVTSKRPKGVKASDFKSSSGAVGLTFAPKFKVPGTYEFVCTYHKNVMRMNVKVKK